VMENSQIKAVTDLEMLIKSDQESRIAAEEWVKRAS